MRNLLFLLFLITPGWSQPLPASQRSGGWQTVLDRCRARTPRLEKAEAFGARVRPTADGSSFFLEYASPQARADAPLLVTLHGHESWAADEVTLWKSEVDRRGWRMLALQWWFGNAPGQPNYYRPQEMYPLIEGELRQRGVAAGGSILHGFSMGSANSYALAGLDRDTGNRFFGLCIANAGSAEIGFPPTAAVRSLAGTRWVLYAGGLDRKQPDMTGTEGMTRTSLWLQKMGAEVVLFLKDPGGDHGGFHQRPQNMRAALDCYRR